MYKEYGSWKAYIEALKAEFIGKNVSYEGKTYNIVDVDYNGIIHINRPTEHNKTTAAFEPHEAKRALI